jgi:predicted transport protein
MTLKAYLDNIKAQTGKTPDDFRVLAEKKGLLKEGVKTGEIVAWLKDDFGLGRGHAMAIVMLIQSADKPRVSKDEKVATFFKGDKARWQAPYEQLMARVKKFGPDVSVAPTDTYISLVRKGRKFAILGVTAGRLDLGIKLKKAPPAGRFEAAGSWNAMVTHRVRITDAKQIDAEVLGWLQQAYQAAAKP